MTNIKIWTILSDFDGMTSAQVFASEEAMVDAVRADVEEAAGHDGWDLGEGETWELGEGQWTGDKLDPASIGDLCQFIEAHGWKCNEYGVTVHDLDIDANKIGA